MKKITLAFLLLIFSSVTIASELFYMPITGLEQTKSIFANDQIIIHFYNDRFVVATAESSLPAGAVLLDDNAWERADKQYFILNFNASDKEIYLETLSGKGSILFDGTDFVIIRSDEKQSKELIPAVHGGIIRITSNEASFPAKSLNYKPGSIHERDEIADLIEEVNMDTLEAFVQHLQDFGTRNAYKPGGINAQNWIVSKFEAYGLATELHDFTMPSGPASDNVIATLPGTTYPDEYVVLGAHYDSYAGGNNEPGADDNATGTAGILEAARILSQYSFDRTIIFATWSGEEYGLYGSEAWASDAAQEGLNILGYFNIDMAGYLEPGNPIHTDIIAPSSANELRQFYKDVCAIYLPEFQTFNGALSGGDSDHTSFNNNGYQGIFPFEDSQDYSPYIHTSNDLIGPSVNNFEQHRTFVQATIASVVTLSDQLAHPENLTAEAGDQQVSLAWDAVEGTEYYNIYRNDNSEPIAAVTSPDYTDLDVTNGTSYSYYVTSVFLENGEESGPSNLVTVIPMPPISLPFFDDFETGAPYWMMEDSWGLQTGTSHSSVYSMTESPSGDYAANLDISTTLRALDFTWATSANLSFWTRYNLETNYDYMYLEVSTNGSDWDELDSFNGVMNTWVQRQYILDEYLGKSNVIIRFRFVSDVYVEEDGMYIDDLEVNVTGVGLDELLHQEKVSIRPNPAADLITVSFSQTKGGPVKVFLIDESGKTYPMLVKKWVPEGSQEIRLDVSAKMPGIYLLKLEAPEMNESRKVVITR